MEKEINYKGITITKLHPSGMYEFYCDSEKRFLKFDDLQKAKDKINKEEKPKTMDLKQYISEEVKKFHKKTMLESELEFVNKKLNLLKEAEGENVEEKSYESNVYESYRKDLEEVVKSLAEACNRLESAVLRQDQHMKNLPQVESRTNEGMRHKEVILDIFKEVKKAKIAAERKLYEMR
jgi:Holliday junction resolvase RusA-like endonuclease